MQVPIEKGRQKSLIIISCINDSFLLRVVILFGARAVSELKRMSLAYYYMSKISTTMTSHVLTLSVYLCCLLLLLQRVLKLHFFICDSYIQILARY